MEEPVQQGGDRRRVAQELPPVIDGSVRREQRGGPLVATHDDLEQVLRGCTSSNQSGPMSLFRKRDFIPVNRLRRCV